jgi:hypothetical protein
VLGVGGNENSSIGWGWDGMMFAEGRRQVRTKVVLDKAERMGDVFIVSGLRTGVFRWKSATIKGWSGVECLPSISAKTAWVF